jgi:uncharacterized delta-60 repeat protein
MKPKRILSLLLGYSLAFTATAQPGSLDVEFGVDGIVSTGFGQQFVHKHKGLAVLVQADGKILTAGTSGDKAVIARFNPDGTVDSLLPSGGFFDEEGAIIFNGLFVNTSSINALAVQQDGKIVAAGTVNLSLPPLNLPESHFIIFRRNADGSNDYSFGYGGKGHVWWGESTSARSVAIQPDGKIVIAGTQGHAWAMVARCFPNGQRDTTFGTDGLSKISYGAPINTGSSMVLQPNGKIVVGGRTGSYISPDFASDFAIARFNSDGSLDGGFGTDGTTVTPLTDGPDGILSMELLPNGKILAIGYGGDSLAVTRYTNGNLDSSFGENGKAFVHIENERLVGTSSVLQSDGKLLIAGYSGPEDGDTDDFLLVRLTPEGDLDDSFGDDGIVVTDLDSELNRLYDIAVQQAGKILTVGYKETQIGSEFIVARYLSGLETGVDDKSILKNKILVYPNPAFDFVSFRLQGQRPPNSGGVFRIVNAGGRLMKTFQSDRPDATFIVPVWDWAAGVYFLQYLEAGVVRVSEKFIKQ